MITGIFGKAGNGKGVLLAQMIERDVKKGITVAANFKIDGAVYCPDYTDWLYFAATHRDAKLYIDEAEVVLGSRDWAQIPKAMRVLFLQHRHIGLDLIWATVRPDGVDKSLRELTHVFLETVKIFPGWPQNPYPDGSYDLLPIFRVREYDGFKPSQRKKAKYTRYAFYRSRWGHMYDAGQLVAPLRASKDQLDQAMAALLGSTDKKARNIR